MPEGQSLQGPAPFPHFPAGQGLHVIPPVLAACPGGQQTPQPDALYVPAKQLTQAPSELPPPAVFAGQRVHTLALTAPTTVENDPGGQGLQLGEP